MLSNHDLFELEKSILLDSYYEFFKAFWPTVVSEEFEDNWHIKYLCDEVQIVLEWVIRRQPKLYDLAINISPGESKSTICTILAPAWLWARDASLRVISSSHSAPLGIEHATLTRDCIKSDKFQHFFGSTCQIRSDIDAKTMYKTVQGGYRKVASVGGKVTGSHAHLLIADDIIDPAGVTSEPALLAANTFLTKTLATRKVSKKNTPTILIMQRLHERDPTAELLSKDKPVRHICIPATTEYPIQPPELAQFYRDGIMNPTRTDATVLATLLAELGPTDFACQFGQQPGDPKGNKIKKEWWRYFLRQNLPTHLVWDMWIDGAYTDDTANDPTGIMICGFDSRHRLLYIRYAESKHMEMPECLDRIATLCAIHGISRRSTIYIEPKASGKTMKQMLNRIGDIEASAVEIKSYLTGEGKEARIQVSAPKVAGGQVWILACPETEIVTHENEQYPKAKHDEHVDNLGYACAHYFGKPEKRGARRRN